MVQASDELAVAILKRIRENVSCGICKNILTNPMRTNCGHRFCYYCIVNALGSTEDICNCPKCNAAVNRNRLIQDIVFGKVVNKANQLIESIHGSELTDQPTKEVSPGKRRLPTERYDEIDLDRSIEETEAEAREMARDVGNKGTKRPLDTVNEPIEAVKRSAFAKPQSSTPNGSGKERELSPFPVSFLNKFTLQADKRPSDKQASPSPKRLVEPLHRKLSFEGDERRELLMSDSSDSEDRRIRPGHTYNRFDRMKQSLRRNNCVQTETVSSEKKNQSQQTDGTNNSDLYSTLSNLFNCLCTQHGIQGSIVIEGIGRFEIALSKATENPNGSQIDESRVALMVDKLLQTDPLPAEPKPILKETAVNTSKLITREKDIQTEVASEKHDRASSAQGDFMETQVIEDDPEEEPELVININGVTKEHHDKLGDIEVSHEISSISQIVKEFSEDPITSQDTDENGRRYSPIMASTRLNVLERVDKVTDGDATEIISKFQDTTTKEAEESDIEDDPKKADEESNIVLESDDDDKFLMSCVFDTLNDDDDEYECGRTAGTSSTRSSAVNNSTKNLGETSESGNDTRTIHDSIDY